MLKFTPRIQEVKSRSKNNKPTDKPASFIKISPPILTKTLKEVNEISKFFKNFQLSLPKNMRNNRKSYA